MSAQDSNRRKWPVWPAAGFEDTEFGVFMEPGGVSWRDGSSLEFKLEAVRLVKERGVAVSQASQDLGVHQTQLRQWVKDFAGDPQHSFPGHGQMKPEQAEIAQLKREVTKLKAERDILKKAAMDSIGERNALDELSTRRLIAKCFPRPGVEFERYGIEVFLAVNR